MRRLPHDVSDRYEATFSVAQTWATRYSPDAFSPGREDLSGRGGFLLRDAIGMTEVCSAAFTSRPFAGFAGRTSIVVSRGRRR